MVTQAPATAFACSQLATLAQKKRCLGTASQSLGVYVRCRLRRPLLRRLAAAAGCKQDWAIGAGMNLALAGQEPYPPLSP